MQSFFGKKITIYLLFKSILKEAYYKKRSGFWGLAPFALTILNFALRN